MSLVVPRSGNVNKQSARRIHPSRIDHIQLVRLFPVHIVGVDLQHIISSFRYARRLVMEDGHVVIAGEVVHRGFGHLDIGIGIPRKNLGLG